MSYSIKKGKVAFKGYLMKENVITTEQYINFLFKVFKLVGAKSIEFEKSHDFDERDLGYMMVYGKNPEEEKKKIIEFDPEYANMVAHIKGANKTVDIRVYFDKGNPCFVVMDSLEEKAIVEAAKIIDAVKI